MEVDNHIFKNVRFLQSPNYNDRPDKEKISLLIIHCISLPEGSYEGSNVEDFFLNKLSISDHNSFDEIKDLKVSSHLYIKRNGELVQFVPFNKRAWHAGESTYKGVSDCNNYSIGIELEGTDDDFYTDDQYDTLIEATKCIIKNYPLINKDSIVGHSDVSPGRKTDPGSKLDWGRFLEALWLKGIQSK